MAIGGDPNANIHPATQNQIEFGAGIACGKERFVALQFAWSQHRRQSIDFFRPHALAQIHILQSNVALHDGGGIAQGVQ